ncbi:ABC transporter ATP-binding protein [Anaerostipes sp.]|uniref:ABC transporter ATP-binding protein n=1 Tax=Anaerostipes sp. TaxID=1872530 RepID=UPI00258D1895|nr:ATP-binding cassette domain-containing protein [Anaerostipes sp.]MCI5623338.1 ATP-binding cassette domain-containing protein [Anaerostipes sp.]
MYQIKNLSFRYALAKENSIREVSLNIEEGTMVLIAGPSGCGKTTLLRHLKKELMPKGKRKGEVFYKGKPLEQLKPEESVGEIGYLFQDPSSQMVMDTVWHEIAFGLENLGMHYQQMKRTVAEIVNYFDLQEIYNSRTDELSGGQKQMVNLAALTAMHPRVLVLDEPTAQLDPIGRKNFLEMVEKLQKEFQMTIIMAAHNLEDVMEMADQCIFMKDGRVFTQGTAKAVIEDLIHKKSAMVQYLPQMIRLAGKFHIEPTFSMMKMRNAIQDCSYDVLVKEKQGNGIAMEIAHLYAGYGKDSVLNNLSLKIKNQEIFAVAGANGSGKSTLLKCIAGQMSYDGKVKCKKRIVYLPQDPTVVFVKERLIDDLKEIGEGQEERMDKLLENSGLKEKLQSHPYDLSGGQRQMAALIKVLLGNPEILLLDEPTKGMDRQHVRRFGHFLFELQEEGVTILCVTHDLEFCAEFADRIGMMFNGKIESVDVPEKFFQENYFYTTASAKITRDMDKTVVLPENVRCL